MEQFLPIILILGVLYFVSIRPQQKRAEAAKSMLSSLSIDDDVITIGGMYGRVVDIDDDHIDLAVSAGGTVLRFQKGAIAKVLAEDLDDLDAEYSDVDSSDLEDSPTGGETLGAEPMGTVAADLTPMDDVTSPTDGGPRS